MKIINRKKALKFLGLQAAVLIALIAVQAGMDFARDYRYVGFEKKNNSWISIAETAEGANNACQADLAQAKQDKQTAIFAANPDLK